MYDLIFEVSMRNQQNFCENKFIEQAPEPEGDMGTVKFLSRSIKLNKKSR